MRAVAARRLPEGARTYCDHSAYRSARSPAIAAFIAPDVFGFLRLPEVFEEALFCGRALLPQAVALLVSNDTRFHVLILSQNNVQLYKAERYQIQQVEVPALLLG
jgi:hypothetical protein